MAGMDLILVAYPLVFSVGCVLAAYVAANRHRKVKARRTR
jgi:hypothetical protein